MNSFPFSIDLLTQTLAKQFNGIENEVRIHRGLKNLIDFVCSKNNIIYGTEQVEMVIEHCGLKKLLRGISEQKKEQLIRCIEQFILFNYFKRMSLNFKRDGCPFKVEELEFNSGDLTTGSSTTVGYSAGVAGTNSWNTEKNFRKQPTFEVMYVSGNKRIDEFSLASLYLKHYFSKMTDLTEFQRMQLWQLSNFVSNKGSGLIKLMTSLRDTKFVKNQQHILIDYITNLLQSNNQIREALKLYSFVPYMLELNGTPGIGKSTFVNLLAHIMTEIFPFIESDSMVYCRVNDKFWNGYHQQPIVLFDDSNQNDKLLFNLDNEIIAIGSGQFVHPPMAFEKETIFGSSFVIFTTNEKLLNTTRVNQGAVARRLHTVDVLPKEHLGEMTIDGDFASKWSYKKGVKENAFNLTFDSHSPNYIIHSFLAKLYNQIGTQTQTNNVFEDIFNEFEDIVDEIPLVDSLKSFAQQIENKKMENDKIAEKIVAMNDSFSVESRPDTNVDFGTHVYTERSGWLARSKAERKTSCDKIHEILDQIYASRPMSEIDIHKRFSYTRGNLTLEYLGSTIYLKVNNSGVISEFWCARLGNFETNYAEKKYLKSIIPIVSEMNAMLSQQVKS